MAYISTEEIRQIRTELKENFGKYFKFSVRNNENRGVNVSIMEGGQDLTPMFELPPGTALGGRTVNPNNLKQYGAYEQLAARIFEVIKTAPGRAPGGTAWYDNSNPNEDYFDVAFYINLSVGSYDKPYVRNTAKFRTYMSTTEPRQILLVDGSFQPTREGIYQRFEHDNMLLATPNSDRTTDLLALFNNFSENEDDDECDLRLSLYNKTEAIPPEVLADTLNKYKEMCDNVNLVLTPKGEQALRCKSLDFDGYFAVIQPLQDGIFRGLILSESGVEECATSTDLLEVFTLLKEEHSLRYGQSPKM